MVTIDRKDNQTLNTSSSFTLLGKSISPGLSQGLIHIHHSLLGPIDVSEQGNGDGIEYELSRLDRATATISDDLLVLATRVEKQIDARLAEVFATHQLMVNDRVLRDELRQEIVDNLVSASNAVKTVFLRWEKRFLLMESQIARDKGDDMYDISIRLQNALAGITVHSLDKIPDHCVLVTSRLLPSDTVFLAGRPIAAVLLQYGSSGSHAALFAREMGLPAIAGIPDLFASVPDNTWALVDADRGAVTIRPDTNDKTVFQEKIKTKARIFETARVHALRPAMTKDGVFISVLANVGCREDTEKAMLNGADGIGLYRIEQVYLGRSVPPDKDELINEMRETLAAAKGHAIYVRLLDIGADKPLPFLGFMAETNPALGRRGIRLLLEYPELLTTQLSAILELSRKFDIRVLIPMVTLPGDVLIVKEQLMKLREKMALSALPSIGAMIETPAAALSAQTIAKYVDFLSFGTNDLTQYTFAADRDNAAVEQYFNDGSDVIFRLIQLAHNDVPGMPLSLCGELAGRPEHIPDLLQCGIRTFSVAPPLIPQVKQAIRDARCLA